MRRKPLWLDSAWFGCDFLRLLAPTRALNPRNTKLVRSEPKFLKLSQKPYWKHHPLGAGGHRAGVPFSELEVLSTLKPQIHKKPQPSPTKDCAIRGDFQHCIYTFHKTSILRTWIPPNGNSLVGGPHTRWQKASSPRTKKRPSDSTEKIQIFYEKLRQFVGESILFSRDPIH